MTTTENKLHFIVVPIDATKIELLEDDETLIDRCFLSWRTMNGQMIKLNQSKWFEGPHEIVGTIHPENGGLKWSFDPEKYVDRIHVEEMPSHCNDMAGGWRTEFMDYENVGPDKCAGYQGDSGYFRKATDSFLSKMKAESDLYFFNPLGERQPESGFGGCDGDSMNAFSYELKSWQEAEAKRITQKVLVLKSVS